METITNQSYSLSSTKTWSINQEFLIFFSLFISCSVLESKNQEVPSVSALYNAGLQIMPMLHVLNLFKGVMQGLSWTCSESDKTVI